MHVCACRSALEAPEMQTVIALWHLTLSDGCTTLTEVTTAPSCSWSSRQVDAGATCIPNLGFLHQWMTCTTEKGGVRWSRPSNETTNPRTTRSCKSEGGSTVYQTWVVATVSLTLPNLQVSAISVVEREGVVCWNAWVQAINNWMGMDSGTHSCMHIVTRQAKWERLLNPSKRWNLAQFGTNFPNILMTHTYVQ